MNWEKCVPLNGKICCTKIFTRTKQIENEYTKWKKSLNVTPQEYILKNFIKNNFFTVKKSNFPYNIESAEHYIIWFNPSNKYKLYTSPRIVNGIIGTYFDTYKYIYFRNIKFNRSIDGIPHIHVLIKSI